MPLQQEGVPVEILRASLPTLPAVEKVVEALTAAILDLVELYCNAFNADFQPAVPGSRKHALVQEACHLSGALAFTVYATHRIPITWVTR